jgi:hypothetical protein
VELRKGSSSKFYSNQRNASSLARRISPIVVFFLTAALMAKPIFSAEADPVLPFGAQNLIVESPDGRKVIGHMTYTVTRSPQGAEAKGETRLTDGERDIEEARLELLPDNSIPLLASYSHNYFNADGSPQRAAQLDLKTGEATCTEYQGGEPQVRHEIIEIAPDTYAGASLALPVINALRQGMRRKIRFHAFSCVPGPRVLTVEANVVSSNAHWDSYPGNLLETEIKPYLGWFSIVASPFLPKFYAWFDPADNWSYVGSRNQRYYKGPSVLLVKALPAAPSSASPTSAQHPRGDKTVRSGGN